jgi:membrane-bound lytic murein transglycosylase D
VAGHVADNGQLSLAPEVVTRRKVIRAGKRDSVASIARRYRLSAAQVADWNDVGASAVFKAGQQVILHLPVRARAPIRASRGSKARSPVRATPRSRAIQKKRR